VLVVVTEVLVVDDVVLVLVVVATQGFGSHVPGPAEVPPCPVHCSPVSSSHVNAPPTDPGNAPPGDDGIQHWIVDGHGVQQLFAVPTVPCARSHASADGLLVQRSPLRHVTASSCRPHVDLAAQ